MGKVKLELTSKRNRKVAYLLCDQFAIDMKPSLMNYMRNGWTLNCSIAIDFTLSNKPINHNFSKHRQDMKRTGDMNQYEKAIYEVGSVL